MSSRDNTHLTQLPLLTSPRFQLAKRAAQSVLLELGNPEPPIPFEPYIIKKTWRVLYDELHGPDGYMMKNVSKKGRTRFAIYLATDMDPESAYDEETIRRRQYFTMAHELGHILLHGRFLLNSEENMTRIPKEIAGIMEVEAHWFAAQLLMPNYVFRSITDLIPDQLADKCGVNLTPASKRLRNLEQNIKTSLYQGARLDKWPNYNDIPIPGLPARSTRNETWSSFAEAAVTSEMLYICKKCGLLHNEYSIWDAYCEECDGELVKVHGAF